MNIKSFFVTLAAISLLPISSFAEEKSPITIGEVEMLTDVKSKGFAQVQKKNWEVGRQDDPRIER